MQILHIYLHFNIYHETFDTCLFLQFILSRVPDDSIGRTNK